MPAPASPGSLYPPFTPASYIALRRTASGLTVEQAAARIATRADEQAEIRALIRMLETPGNLARHPVTLDVLRAAYPLDPDVYYQLANEPADRHPRICRGCGCSEWDACDRYPNAKCGWAGAEICTRCSNGEKF